MMEPSLRVRRRQKWNIGRKKLEATPILAPPNFVSIINFVELRLTSSIPAGFAPVPVFQKHNISIKVLTNNDITNNLISNSRYIY